MKATIKDVAKRAGVSISTVSLVVNNKNRVSDGLRQRVLDAIKELDYRPNTLARGLKSKKSQVIGLIIPDIANPFFPLMVRGVEDAAKQYKYTMLLCNTDGKVEEEAKYLELLEEKCVDGIIFTPSGKLKKNLQFLKELAIPKVILDRRLDDLSIPTVTVDNKKGAYIATNHLIQNGKKDILFISGPDHLQSSLDRLNGYQWALQENQLSFRRELLVHGDFSFESGKRVIREVIAQEVKFDAVFGANDLMALGAMTVLEDEFSIPDQIEVVGYDDIQMALLFKPTLSTIRQPAYEMGYEAVKLVLRAINSKKVTTCCKVFEPELIIRQSSPRR